MPLKSTFWLHFYLDGSGAEWMDEKLPRPNYLHHANKGYFIGWQLDGYFATQKGVEYLNDIIGRITITLKDCRPKRLPFKPDLKEVEALYYPKIRRLLEFRDIKSLSKKIHAPSRADAFGGSDDYCFWAIKLYTEDLIREYEEGTPVPSHLIEDWAYSQFSDHKKGMSTVRAKCRSIWNWYDERDWELPKIYKRKYTDEEYYMTRRERAISNAKAKSEKARKAVITAVTGIFSDEYKKKNGSWHIIKLAEATGLSRRVVSKHLKLWEDEISQAKGIKA